MSSNKGASLLAIAQLSDGLSTPLVGYLSDYYNKGLGKYPKRKSWHLAGTIINIITPYLLFREPYFKDMWIDDENPSNVDRYFWYYLPWVVFFPMSYAMIQVNHFALIPELSPDTKIRNSLSSFAYMGLISGFIYTYIVASSLLGEGITVSGLNVTAADELCKIGQNASKTSDFTSQDLPVFQTLVLIIVLSSIVASTIFHIFVREKTPQNNHNILRSEEAIHAELKVFKKMMLWFKNINYYMIFVLYVVAQLLLGVPIIYTPMFLTQKHTWISKTWMVYLQIIFFISGIPATMLVKILGNKFGMQLPYFLGCLLIACGSVLLGFVDCNLWLVILIFGLFGAGANGLTCSAMALVAQLIGENTDTGAVVFASMALGDKLSLAFLIKIIGYFEDEDDKGGYYENIMRIGLLGLVAIGILGIVANWMSLKCGKKESFDKNYRQF